VFVQPSFFLLIFAPPTSQRQEYLAFASLFMFLLLFFSFLFESFGPAVLQSACQVVILVSRLVNVLNLGKVLVLMMMI
jgi:hypothetical protein